MKRIYLILFAVAASWTQRVHAQTAATALSLQQCIEYAKVNNPNLKNAQAGIDAAKARVGETVATGLPQIAANADLGSNFIIPTSFLPAEILGGPKGEFVGVKFGTQYVGRATIDVNQMIFNGSYFVGL